MDDLIQMGAVLLAMTFLFIVGVMQIFRKDVPTPPSMRSENIRRLGLREKEACLLYNEKDIMMATELRVLMNRELLQDEIRETFETLADENAMLRCAIVTRKGGKMYFVPMEEVRYDIKLVSNKTWTEEIEKVLRRKYDDGVGPLWSIIYSHRKLSQCVEGKSHDYGFAIAYHPALLDQFSSRHILKDAMEHLTMSYQTEEDESEKDERLFPSLDSLLKPKYFRERLLSLGFVVKCFWSYIIPTSSLKSGFKDRMKNTFVNMTNVDRYNYKEVDKKTSIFKFKVDIDVDHSDIEEKAKELKVEIGTLLLVAVSVGFASLKEENGDPTGPTEIKSSHIADGRDLAGVNLGQRSMGSYQYECQVNTVIPKTQEVIGAKKTLVELAKHCQRRLKVGKSRTGCQRFLWEHRFLSTIIRPRINIDKVLAASKDRLPTDVIFDFCDVTDDISVVWMSTSRGLGRQGPVVYVSAGIIKDAVVFTVTYSSAVLSESDITKACDVTKETLLKMLS